LVTPNNVTGIIVADDDSVIRDVLRTRLEALDLNVFLACDGLEAVDLALRIDAALIILDLKMPRLNGLLACERIRQLPRNAKTPIAILTALPGMDAAAAAAEVGATAYFAKPFRPVLLLQALSQFLPISDAMRDQIRHNADLASGIARPPAAPTGVLTSARPGSEGPLDRGKNILDVLRS
jgi:CheY-like chemotaxis protein